MKVIFLDVDGVLNSDASIMSDDALEDALILNLKELVERTNAKIILSSSWRFCFNPLRKLMQYLNKVNLQISGMTPNGVSLEWLQAQGFIPTKRYLDSVKVVDNKEIKITCDRGAEIMKWLSENEVESFVILDDDDFDIALYYPNNFVKTQFRLGLTKHDVNRAAAILGE